MNHYPLPIARKLPSHAATGDTANPNTHIDCPICRNMLAESGLAHREEAISSRSEQHRSFFNSDAARREAILNQ